MSDHTNSDRFQPTSGGIFPHEYAVIVSVSYIEIIFRPPYGYLNNWNIELNRRTIGTVETMESLSVLADWLIPSGGEDSLKVQAPVSLY